MIVVYLFLCVDVLFVVMVQVQEIGPDKTYAKIIALLKLYS